MPATYFTKIIKKTLNENLNTIGFTETKTFIVYKNGIWSEESKKYVEKKEIKAFIFVFIITKMIYLIF